MVVFVVVAATIARVNVLSCRFLLSHCRHRLQALWVSSSALPRTSWRTPQAHVALFQLKFSPCRCRFPIASSKDGTEKWILHLEGNNAVAGGLASDLAVSISRRPPVRNQDRSCNLPSTSKSPPLVVRGEERLECKMRRIQFIHARWRVFASE